MDTTYIEVYNSSKNQPKMKPRRNGGKLPYSLFLEVKKTHKFFEYFDFLIMEAIPPDCYEAICDIEVGDLLLKHTPLVLMCD